MSSNVDVVKSVYAAFARRDIPAVLAAFDRDISWQTPATLPWSAGAYHGPEGVGIVDTATVRDSFTAVHA
ncbi:hypothetical protein H7X46_19115 [Pseudonocardia sp. C8]|uniref:hypothetical protein n=1 Tax=Pseudonocardia sp. C8 TaxID=2762759 RepID=UPI001642A314|nr:hypothetical protein [Pseudonocardia sp. C8]MBC3193174.1 hypothetical protein [Pseudonocardia sp. C8]